MAETTQRARERLIAIVKARSFQSGKEITLASGRTSTYYFNMKPTMMDAEGAHLIATLILDAIGGLRADLIGGLEMGAVPLASAVAAACASSPVGSYDGANHLGALSAAAASYRVRRRAARLASMAPFRTTR